MTYHVAQLNPGRVHHPLDHPEMAEFTGALETINALAEGSPGFVWRLVDEDGGSSSYVQLPDSVPGADDPLLLPNLSVWEDVESFKHFVYKTDHSSFLRRRAEWFKSRPGPSNVCWWIPAGTVPDLADAFARFQRLHDEGPLENGWTIAKPFPMPTAMPGS